MIATDGDSVATIDGPKTQIQRGARAFLRRLGGVPRWIGAYLPLGFAIAAPFCAILTYAALPGSPLSNVRGLLTAMLIIDFCLVIGLLALVAWRIATLFLSRRSRSAGSRLHLRMVRMFTILSVSPAILLGLFAAVTVTFGLEGWFNQRVAAIVDQSAQVAQAYARERNGVLIAEIGRAVDRLGRLDGADARALGGALQEIEGRGNLYYVIDGDGTVIAQSPRSWLFHYTPPEPVAFESARRTRGYLFGDAEADEARALARTHVTPERFIYIVQRGVGDGLQVLERTKRAVAQYHALEERRQQFQLVFGGLYIGFALLVVLAAIWFGIWFADRLVRPIGHLAAAAERVAGGDFGARVMEEKGDDEIATLSRGFNRMTEQVQLQRDQLVAVNRQIDERRRFTETVLSGIGAGVLGLDAEGRIELANEAAGILLQHEDAPLTGLLLAHLVPEFAPALDRARASLFGEAEDRVRAVRNAIEMEFLVRVAVLRPDDREAGQDRIVVTFDDMTDLVSAQRLAAWADVARRVAHEIKNPLTPIQLSTERLRRKFGRQIETDLPVFEQCVDTIIRQVDDIRRMVDEFSQFARMPEPMMRAEDLGAVLGDAVALQSAADPSIAFETVLPEGETRLRCDRSMMAQVFTNLLKNAVEAVQARHEGAQGGRIRAAILVEEGALAVEIADNGIGLPKLERRRLTEPYVTTRRKGTGLGLAIVKRIVEQHGGRLVLSDAAPMEPDAAPGALVRIVLPKAAPDAAQQQPQEHVA